MNPPPKGIVTTAKLPAPRAVLHFVAVGDRTPSHCLRCGVDLSTTGSYTDDAAIHRSAESFPILMRTVDAWMYSFVACRGRS